MEEIISPTEKSVLIKELTKDLFIRPTNKGDNEIYIFNHKTAPNLLKEVGRLREITFRVAGGGTGKSLDLDNYDEDDYRPYEQLIVWDPNEEEIVGGYRFIRCNGYSKSDQNKVNLATTKLFDFSDEFVQEFLPYTIELGRSFVQPKYQPSPTNRIGLFSLDNLWDGLGAIVVDYPETKYFFGKVTMYLDFNQKARDYILSFMNYYFPDSTNLVKPKLPLGYHHDTSTFLNELKGKTYKEGHKTLNGLVRKLDENIPPLINAYMNLSLTMKTFGTAMNYSFGEVEETGILVTISDIYDTKKERHVNTYKGKK